MATTIMKYTRVGRIVQDVLLKALPPVCMKYTAQGESQVANMRAIFVMRL